jgi:hypothetical protein
MSNLQRSIEISIVVGKVERKYNVTFPSVGQYINVEARKAQLTVPKGLSFDQSTQYLNMIRQSTISSNLALDMVDMIAWFETCIPKLMEEHSLKGIESIDQLDIFDAKPLMDAYKNVFKPWKSAWELILQGLNKEEDNKKEDGKVPEKGEEPKTE